MQVLLERCIQSGSTQEHGIAFTELNKHVEDPLSTFSSAQSIDTVLDRPLTSESAEHLHVPVTMLDQELDLSRYVLQHLLQASWNIASYMQNVFTTDAGLWMLQHTWFQWTSH